MISTKTFFCTFFSLACWSFFAQAQNLEILNQNPPSVKWQELNTAHFRLIFPESYLSQSQKVANILEAAYIPVSQSLGAKPRKYPIILQNQMTVSNGFVSPINHRSEFFTTPPQSPINGSLNWIEGLAVHELRHIAQFERALQDKKINIISKVIGDFGLGFPSLFIPDWFYEGDAVGTETALTASGRGRVPEFDVLLRSQLLTQKPFRYSKAMNGSYRDNVTNHYVMGYFLTSYLKNNHGADVWDKVLGKTFNNFLFARSIRKVTGLKINQLYANAMQEASERWKTRLEENKSTEALHIYAPHHRFYTNYLYPQLLDDGSIVALKNGLGNIPQLVLITTKGEKQSEKVLHTLGNWNDSDKLSIANNQLLWTEFELDPRWMMRNYSILKTFDLNTKTTKSLTHKTRYFAPAFSADAQQIVAVEFSEEGMNNLVILDKNGTKIKVLKNPDNDFFQQPVWTADGKSIIYIRQNKAGKCIEMTDVSTEIVTQISNFTHENIVTPIDFGDFVVFTAPYQGSENLFAIHKKSKEQYQITNSKFGAYYPSANTKNKRIVYNEHTPQGKTIADAPTDWKLLENGFKIDEKVQFFGKFMQQEPQNIFANLSIQKYEVKPFKKINNLLRIYGWGPAVTNDASLTNPTVGIISQDLLSNAIVKTGIGYNVAEKSPNYFAKVSYQAWYPILDFGYESGKRSSTMQIDKQLPLDSLRTDQWSYQRIETGFRIPFRFTHSRFNETASIGVHFAHHKVSNYDLPVRKASELFNGAFQTMQYQLSYQKTLKQSSLDVAPRLGFSYSLSYRHTPFGGQLQAEQLGTFVHIYLPGFAKFHAIRLQAGMQKDRSGYQFTAAVPFVRGQSYTLFNTLKVASLDYRFPIFYPDWSIGRIGSIKRFKGNLWADTGLGTVKDKSYNLSSMGFDLTANMGITGLIPDLEIGLRTIYNVDTGAVLFRPLIVNIGF
jgi:hypothetical protein